MTDQLQAAAKAGDIKAIEALMNKAFEPKGLTVRVTNSGRLLKVVIRGKTAPDRALLPTIKAGLANISPQGFDQFVVTARAIGKSNAWSYQGDFTKDEQPSTKPKMASAPPAPQPKPLPKVDSVPPKPEVSTATSDAVTGQEQSKAWYQRNWLIIGFLVLSPVIGIPLAWVGKWPKVNKIGASVASGLWFLLLLISTSLSEPQTTTAQESEQPTAIESQLPEANASSANIIVDPEGFFSASESGDLNVVNAMLAAGISPDTANEVGMTALAIAASRGNLDVVKAIIEAGPSQSTKDLALLDSTISTSEVTVFLLRNGANPRYTHFSQVDKENQPVLYSAARFGTPDHVKALLNAGASWDQLTQEQANTALRGASCGGWKFIVQELLDMGADPNNMNVFEDESPLILASSQACRTRGSEGQGITPGSRQHDQVLQLLKAAGAE